MNTPLPSATGAHTRVTLKRSDLNSIEVHATVASFDRSTGGFTAFMDIDPQGVAAEQFTISQPAGTFTDSQGFSWTLIR